jgi:hypothetical protein
VQVYTESSPSYSENKKFYFQMKFTICRDAAKSRASLVMGQAGKEDEAVLLDFGSSMDIVNASCHEGPELQCTLGRRHDPDAISADLLERRVRRARGSIRHSMGDQQFSRPPQPMSSVVNAAAPIR